MPNLPISQLPLALSGQPSSLMVIVNYDVESSGITNSIYYSALTEQFSGSSGTSGTSGINGSNGTSGSSGTSGFSGDLYRTTSSTPLTIQMGSTGTFVVGTNLGYSIAQDVIIAYDLSNHMIGMVVSYNPSNGDMVVDVETITGSGLYSDWTVNLGGAAGGNGSSGTSGTSGIDGSSGTSGTSGTSGSNGTSGSSGSSGSSGTSGTSAPTPPFPLVYGLFSQTGNSVIVSGTTTESTLIDGGIGTLSVPANGFVVGDSFSGSFGGILNSKNNETIRIRVKSGSVVLLDSGVQTLTSGIINDIWLLSIKFTIRQLGVSGVASIVSLGSFSYAKTNNGTIQGFSFNTVNNTTFDTTVNNTLDVTVQWGSTNVENNIYSDIFVLNKIY
jgi:hypothetical protein